MEHAFQNRPWLFTRKDVTGLFTGRARTVLFVLAGGCAAIAAVALLGWWSEQWTLVTWVPFSTPMVPNTALAVLLLSAATVLALLGPRLLAPAALAATGAIVIGMLTLVQYAFGLDNGVDRAIFSEKLLETSWTGRPSPNSALLMVLSGTAILGILRNSFRTLILSNLCALLTFFISYVLMVQHFFAGDQLLGLEGYYRTALPTSIAFVLLSIVTLLTKPGFGWMKMLTSDDSTGRIVRKLLVASFAIPLFVRVFIAALEVRFSLSASTGIALMIAFTSFLLAAIGIWSGLVQHRAEKRKLSDERAAQRLREERAAELDRMNRELAEARDRALEASALKSAFVANISHEIRTPLSGILGMNELLLQTDMNEEQRELAMTVQASSQSLLTVLNDVLDLSKIEAGKLSLEHVPFNIVHVTQDSVRLMAAAAKQKDLNITSTVDYRIPELVIGDPERLRQVLLNVIGNAVKFTERGSVTVSAELVSIEDNIITVRFNIKDTGIGIEESERKYIFMPFAQADNTGTRRFGGTGLGLAISKQLAEIMGGEMGFDSIKGEGSTFWFTAKFIKNSTDSGPPLPAERLASVFSPKENTVLIAEDNSIMRDLLVKNLTRLGMHALVVRTGAEAVEAASGTAFDLILLDHTLPALDAIEAASSIREIELSRNRHTPVVVMTPIDCELTEMQNDLFDACLVKPVGFEELRELITRWVAARKKK